jgi:hypothetical protein
VTRTLTACVAALTLVLASSYQARAASFGGDTQLVPYIVGGQASSISQFPWQVFVLLEEGNGELGSCGGSILDTTHVLTAAHCVDHEGSTTSYPASDLTVIAGASEVLLSSDEARPSSRQIVEVKSFRTHPYYTVLPNVKDDVAVLELAEPLELSPSKNTQAISLVSANATPVPGTTLSISGYGKEEGAEGEAHEPDGKLYSTTLTAIGSDACRNSVGVNSAVLLCAESPSSATCQGDSGGPLTEGSPAVQVGIVDFGPKECPGRPARWLLEHRRARDPRLHRRQRIASGRSATDFAAGNEMVREGSDRVHSAHLRIGRVERLACAHLHLPTGKRFRADAPERAGQRVRAPRQPGGCRRRVHRAGDQPRRRQHRQIGGDAPDRG